MTAARHVELLAPAGEPRALRAALAAGADAVYFGLERWSARAFAGNFAGETAVEAVETAHLCDARAHLALNTLLKDDEIEPALAALEAPYLAGLDALIVADLGFAARVRERYPGLPLHASTQLNTHCSAQLRLWRGLASRGRSSRASSASTRSPPSTATVSSSRPSSTGRSATATPATACSRSMVGGRSGNRGRCSQSCRLRYDLRRWASDPRPPATGAAAAPRAGAAASCPPPICAPSACCRGCSPPGCHLVQDRRPHEGCRLRRRRRRPSIARPWTRRSPTPKASRCGPSGVRVSSRASHGASRRHILTGATTRCAAAAAAATAACWWAAWRRSTSVGARSGATRAAVAAGDVVYLYTPWGQTEPHARRGGRRRRAHAARARARRRQGPPLPAGGRRRRGSPATSSPVAAPCGPAAAHVPRRARRAGRRRWPSTTDGRRRAPSTVTSLREPLAPARTAALTATKRARRARRAWRHAVPARRARVRPGRRAVPRRRRSQGPAPAGRGGARRAPPGRPPARGKSAPGSPAEGAPHRPTCARLLRRRAARPRAGPPSGEAAAAARRAMGPTASTSGRSRPAGGHGRSPASASRRRNSPLRLRLPEVLFDADAPG